MFQCYFTSIFHLNCICLMFDTVLSYLLTNDLEITRYCCIAATQIVKYTFHIYGAKVPLNILAGFGRGQEKMAGYTANVHRNWISDTCEHVTYI